MNFDKEYILNLAIDLLRIDSPSGYTKNIMNYLIKILDEYEISYSFNVKGGLIFTLNGNDPNYTIGLSAHVDTLGLMVRSITTDGKLKLTPLGGPIIPTLDGEYCKVLTRTNKMYTGTILSNSPAAHVYEDASSSIRNIDNIHIRIDEEVSTKEDVLNLGIQNGDFICIDPKPTLTNSGYIKSRFLDDKICVALLFGLIKNLKENNTKLPCNVTFFISNYEEVGHGASCIPSSINELISVDMGCIGKDLSGSEYSVSICAKDSSGPYDYEITSKLIKLSKENNIAHAVDIFPYYGSDVSAAYRGGNDIKGALIGPGVDASHGMERTHYKGVENTLQLLYHYILSK